MLSGQNYLTTVHGLNYLWLSQLSNEFNGSECPELRPRDDAEIILSNYSTSAGTYVEIICRQFAYHVTPFAVTCVADETPGWYPTPDFSCKYRLDTKEQLLLGVLIGSGLLFFVCIASIIIGAMYGDYWRRRWLRSHYDGDYFDDQKNYPLRRSHRYAGSQDDLDRHRREPSLYGSQNDIDRYDDRDRDYIRRRYLHERGYIDDHDYWRFHRYRDRDYLLDPDLYDARLKYRSREYRDKLENRPDDWDRPPVWYCRRIIDYVDWPPLNGSRYNRYPSRSIINDPPRAPIDTEEAPPRELIPNIPRREPIPFDDAPPIVRQRKRIIIEEVVPPVPALVEDTEKVVLHIEHEPEYIKTNYKDFGYYSVDETTSPPVPPRRMIGNGIYDQNREVEALYSKPIKSNFKVTEIDNHGREIPGGYVRRRGEFKSRDPIVDENLDHVLYHGQGNVTEIFEPASTPERPRLSATQVY